jgi:hypothetical protein
MDTVISENRLVISDIEAFTLFEIDAGAMRHISGPNKGELIFPELHGEYVPLWEVKETTPLEEGINSIWGTRKHKQANDPSSQQRLANVLVYAKHIADGGSRPLHELAVHTL